MRKKLKTGPVAKHGMTGTPTYVSYFEMLKRCYDPTVIRYPRYGGRGIKVCKRWRDSFLAFVEDMGEKPEGYSLDRINNDGDYKPSNCQWADRSTQANNKRNNRLITHDGITQTVAEWEKQTGIRSTRIRNRLDHCNATVEQALSPGPLRRKSGAA